MSSRHTSSAVEKIGGELFQAAKPLHFSIEAVKVAVEAFNANRPAQRWAARMHRNGLTLKRGQAKIDIPFSGVFLHPVDWGIDSNLTGGWGIFIAYTSSTGGQIQNMLYEVGLLLDFHYIPDIVRVWLQEWGQPVHFMVRGEVSDYISQLQGWLADSINSQVA